MRISPVGALYDTQEDVIRTAAISAMSTHNHVEGVKGAIVTAMCTWMAKSGYSKEQIFAYMQKHYSYGYRRVFKDFSYQEGASLRTNQIECTYSVPAAVISLKDSADFTDAIAKATCIGYDTDTNACICGGMAAAMYGLPDEARTLVDAHLAACGLALA